jgi:hypothetical protein
MKTFIWNWVSRESLSSCSPLPIVSSLIQLREFIKPVPGLHDCRNAVAVIIIEIGVTMCLKSLLPSTSCGNYPCFESRRQLNRDVQKVRAVTEIPQHDLNPAAMGSPRLTMSYSAWRTKSVTGTWTVVVLRPNVLDSKTIREPHAYDLDHWSEPWG